MMQRNLLPVSRSHVMFEMLENRRLLSGTPAAIVVAMSTALPTASPARVAVPAVISASKIPGTYIGAAITKYQNITVPVSMSLTMTSTTSKMSVAGYGYYSLKITAKRLAQLRKGVFNYVATTAGETITLVGAITAKGKISGNFSVSGPSLVLKGPFTLTKK
jgi:hypothetical protein